MTQTNAHTATDSAAAPAGGDPTMGGVDAPGSPQSEVPQDALPASGALPAVKHLQLKAALLLVLMAGLMVTSVLFLLHARGFFEPTQRLTLTAEDAEGAVVGMNLTFSGFAIGRVHSIELAKDGNAHIHIDVPRKDAHWLRTSSVFSMVRGLVGGTNIRAYSGIATDPPLPNGAVRAVLKGDAMADIPRVVGQVKELLDNLNSMTSSDSALNKSLAEVQTLTASINGPQGAMGAVFGQGLERQKILAALDRTTALLSRLDGVALKSDTLVGQVNAMAGKADVQVFGPTGTLQDVTATVQQMNALLADTRQSLKKVDAVLLEAQGVGSNVKTATADLGALRGDVEANLRKIEGMVNDINRKWPFAKDAKELELKLP